MAKWLVDGEAVDADGVRVTASGCLVFVRVEIAEVGIFPSVSTTVVGGRSVGGWRSFERAAGDGDD